MLYILGKNNVPCHVDDAIEWGKWFEDHTHRRVALTDVRGVTVSTVFLGIDHDHTGLGVPILFETMVFDRNQDGEEKFYDFQQRYATWEEAEAGHKLVVDSILNGGKSVLQ